MIRARLIMIALMAQAAAAQAPTASIRGTIVSAAEGRSPISGATVEVRRLDGSAPQAYVATTARDGTFQIANIRAGQYTLAARRNGFFAGEYGQRRWNRPGTAFTLTPGQNVEGVQVTLTPAGVIHGRLSDQQGNPVGGAVVHALIPAYRNGFRTMKAVQSTVSDDLGQYRLFDLPPGPYYISATPSDGRTPVMMALVNGTATRSLLAEEVRRTPPPMQEATYLPQYFPGIADSRRASAIDLRMGATYGGADFIVTPSRNRHVRGSASRGRNISLALVPLNPVPGTTTIMDGVDPETGLFDIAGVAPGAYLLIATSEDASGRQLLEVGDGDLNNVGIALGGGFRIPGHVRIEDRPPVERDPDMDHIYFDLTIDPPVPGAPVETYGPLPDGSFALRNLLPGGYRISNFAIKGTAPGLQNGYLKSVRLGEQDVLHRGLQVNGPVEGTLEIVVGTRPGSVAGVVVNESRQPVANATVVLGLDTAQRSPSDMYRIVTTDAAGRFRISPVPPGDFKVFAWEDVEDSAWQDPEFLKGFEDRGIPVRVRENIQENIELTAIR